MSEFSREEIDTLWEQAYYRASGGGNPVSAILLFLVFLLVPIALFGFQSSLLIVWVLLSFSLIAFALYVRFIVDKSKKGSFPARFAIVRALAFGTLALLVLWLSFVLIQVSLSYFTNPRGDFVLAAILTAVVYVLTIPLAFIWGKSETQAIMEKREGVRRSGLNMFGGWMQTYFWVAVLFQTIVLNLLLPAEFGMRLLFVFVPYASLMLFIFVMRGVHFLWTLMQIGIDNSPYQATLKEVKKQLKEERKARRKGPTRIPGWCEGCAAQGEIEVDDSEGNYFLICEVCGTETAQVWCDDSGAGGHFVRNIHEHPFDYKCDMCKQTHTLPDDFYEKPVALELIEEPRRKT